MSGGYVDVRQYYRSKPGEKAKQKAIERRKKRRRKRRGVTSLL